MDVTEQPPSPDAPESGVAFNDSNSLDDRQLAWLHRHRREHPGPVTLVQLRRSMSEEGLSPKRGLAGLKEALAAVGGFEDWIIEVSPEQRQQFSARLAKQQRWSPLRADGDTAAGDDILSLEPNALEALVLKAKEESNPQPLVRLWLLGKSPIDKRARETLNDLDDAAVTEEVCSTVDALLRDTERAALAIGPLRRLTRFHKSETPATLRAIVRERLVEPTATVPVWFEDALTLVLGGTPSDIAEEISTISGTTLGGLLTTATHRRLEPNSLRERLYAAVLRSEHWELLAPPELWKSASLESIARLTKPGPDAPNLLGIIADTVVGPAVTKSVRSMHLWKIFELVGMNSHLLPFINPNDVVKAAERQDVSAQLFVAATTSLSAAHKSSLEEAAREMEALRAQLAEAEERYAAEVERSSQQKREYEQVNERLRRSAVGSIEVHEAQVRQGRIDTLRTLAALAEELRNLAALKQPTSALIQQLSSDAVKHLRDFGVEVVGVAGEQRQHDPRLDGPSNEGAMVEVLSPAYVLAGVDEVTLRHAMTRPLPG